MKKYVGVIISLAILVLIILNLYLPLTKTFYQQDEWIGYGHFLAKGTASILENTGGATGIILGQGRILTKFLSLAFYKFFPLNIFPIAIFAISFHIINTLIIYYLTKKLFKSNLSAFLGSLFFAVSSISQSAITWPAASINTLPSTMLILIALVFYFKYLENCRTKYIFSSFILVYLSLFFKETGIFLLLLLPIFTLIYKKQKIWVFIRRYWYFFATVFLIVVFRLWGFKSETGEVALFLTGSSKYFIDSLIIRSIFYPITSFSLSIVPTLSFLNFARYITNVYYPFISESQFILVAQTVVLDLLAIFMSTLIGWVSFILYKKSDIKIQKQMIFWFIFLLTSFLPYIVISKSYSYLESRYYYVSNISWAIIFAWYFYILKEKIKNVFIYIIFMLIFLAFIYTHINIVKTDMDKLVKESQIRISILDQIKQITPKLDNPKNIFYIISDTDYYVVGNKIPFQQGMGYTLMTIYYKSGKISNDMLKEDNLFEIGSNGYFEQNGYGFGYFSDPKKLKEAIVKYKFSHNDIHSFFYNSHNSTLTFQK